MLKLFYHYVALDTTNYQFYKNFNNSGRYWTVFMFDKVQQYLKRNFYYN